MIMSSFRPSFLVEMPAGSCWLEVEQYSVCWHYSTQQVNILGLKMRLERLEAFLISTEDEVPDKTTSTWFIVYHLWTYKHKGLQL